MTTSMNERTHFFIKIYVSNFIRKVWCWLCVRDELETGTDCFILTQISSDNSFTSFVSWLGCSTVGHWGPQALSLQADSQTDILSPTDSNCNWNSNWLTQAVCGNWLYNCLKSTCFLWAYASAPNSTTSTGQGDMAISSIERTCFAVLLLIYAGTSLDWRLGLPSSLNYFISVFSYQHIPVYFFLLCLLSHFVYLSFKPNFQIRDYITVFFL